MNWFGRKKETKNTPSAVSSTSNNGGGGGGGGATRTTTANTVVNLRESIATQEKREQHLEKKIEQLTAEAKTKMAKKDKKGALFALKRKKLYEAEIDKIANIKMTLETQVMNLESAAQNAETFKAMNAGKNAMSNIRTETNIDKVDDLMDEIKEEMEMADEISNALAQPVDPLLTDEDDLLAELQELEAEDVEEQLLSKPATVPQEEVVLPDVPSSQLPSIPNATKEEEEELKQLEAELAGFDDIYISVVFVWSLGVMDGLWMDVSMDGWMDGWMDVSPTTAPMPVGHTSLWRTIEWEGEKEMVCAAQECSAKL
eukprot:CAMPEP_0183744470 /NCGR_PEP_ID=MMETSP0737-20130205/65744_1 /TAXON_ID=385413 /ORGANISM="Thalassiosira miniscula, Strain CCMP1093" /LENGTH=313 /DNA_ID=CAMNT_0025980111 /DNA_START=707 /DNA_END=1649 /DNA_ORIENTATION=+